MHAPELWIAFLRMVVGAWFLKAVWTKLTVSYAWGFVPYLDVSQRFINFHPKRVAEFAAGNPIDWYREFLQQFVLPNAELFARLQAYGEALVGFTLLLGLCVGLGSVVGLFLSINYGLATQWMSFGQQGFHLLLITSMIIFIGAHAGKAWSISGLVLRAMPARRPRWVTAILASALFSLASSTATPPAIAEVRVFVTNEKTNDVTVIRAEDNQVLGTIQVGQRPRGITVSQDGNRVYVANSNSNNVSVIDAKTMKVIDSFPAGIDPEGMTIDRKGILYAVNENDSAVTIIDTASKSILKTLQVGLEPETAVLSPDQRWVAVSNESSNEIHFLSTADFSIAGKVAVPPNPRGMHFTPDSRQLYVASELGHNISVIDVANRKLLRSVPTGGERPVDIALCAATQRIFVSHGRSEDVRVLNAATLDLLATIPVGPRAWWVALTPDRKFLYVTIGRANEVVVIDTTANSVVKRIAAGGLPWGVAITPVE